MRRKIITREVRTGTPGIRSIVTLECGHVIDVYNPAHTDLDRVLKYAWDGVDERNEVECGRCPAMPAPSVPGEPKP